MPMVEVDPFELPDWLAADEVLWQATDERGVYDGRATVHGHVRPLDDLSSAHSLVVDLLAVDVAWPKAVTDEQTRHAAHEAWHYDQVLLVDSDGRVTLCVPCTEFSSDLVCEAVRRFARAVGADPTHFLVQLRL